MPIASPLIRYRLDLPGCSGIAYGRHLPIQAPATQERKLPIGQTGAMSIKGLPTFTLKNTKSRQISASFWTTHLSLVTDGLIQET